MLHEDFLKFLKQVRAPLKRLFVSALTFIAGAGVITAYFEHQANDIASTQNSIADKQLREMKIQNDELQKQNDLLARQTWIMMKDAATNEADADQIVKQSVSELLSKLSEELKLVAAIRQSMTAALPDSGRCYWDGVKVPYRWQLSYQDGQRIIALTRHLEPYFESAFISNGARAGDNANLYKKSFERGEFLLGLLQLEVDLSDLCRRGAMFRNAAFSGQSLNSSVLNNMDLRGAVFTGCDLSRAYLVGSNMAGAELQRANLYQADLNDAKFDGADLSNSTPNDANFENASFTDANLSGADLGDIHNWRSIKSISGANIHAVRNAPPGFMTWALENGAIDVPPSVDYASNA
jgi:hypothetical protein